MSTIRSYRDLQVWQEAMTLAELCYKRTSGFPHRETYGLHRQIRRASVSVPSNIAEGHSRRTLSAYINHLSIALGSQAELETQIELAHRLVYLKDAEATELLELAGRVGRRLHALIQSLESSKNSVSPPPKHDFGISAPNIKDAIPATPNRELQTRPQKPGPQTPGPRTQHPAPSMEVEH